MKLSEAVRQGWEAGVLASWWRLLLTLENFGTLMRLIFRNFILFV